MKDYGTITIVRFTNLEGEARLQVNGLGGMPICPDCEDTDYNKERMYRLAEQHRNSSGSSSFIKSSARIEFEDRVAE